MLLFTNAEAYNLANMDIPTVTLYREYCKIVFDRVELEKMK